MSMMLNTLVLQGLCGIWEFFGKDMKGFDFSCKRVHVVPVCVSVLQGSTWSEASESP